MAKYRITQIKSKNGESKRQKANLLSLGIHRMHQSVIVELTPVTEGMIERVAHLVTCEPVNE